MLGVKREMGSFLPVDIFSYESKNGKLEEPIRESIAHYNKAIELIKMDSEDIAVLELKRAISLNPQFNEAINILGLCYAYSGDSDKAVEMFKTVVQAENNSIKALDYIGKIDGLSAATELVFTDIDNKAKTSKSVKKPVKQSIVKAYVPQNGFLTNYAATLKYHIICYALFFAIGCAVVWLFKDGESIIPTKDTADKIKIAELDTNIKELTTKNKNLSDELASLKDKQNQGANVETPKSNKTEKLNEIEALVTNKNYEQAADQLLLLKDAGFTGVDKEKFDKLWNDSVPIATQELYYQGTNLFNSQNYKEASLKLSKAVSYGGTWEQLPYAMYNLGKSYAAINETSSAIETYKTLKKNYPNTEFELWANSRLAELGVK